MEILAHEEPIFEYEKTIAKFKKQNKDNGLMTAKELAKLEKKFEELKQKVYGKLSAAERLQICRHSSRPRTIDYIKNIGTDFIELFGDRTMRDDPSVIGGFINIEKERFLIVGQEKGNDTESRIHRNFGMLSPEGFRKSLRLMQLAGKFSLPIITLIDTPGAYPGLEAEERGQGWIIAKNLMEMSQIPSPIITIIIGEGFSGGALGMAVGDVTGMLEHSYYSVISPEGCASILWKDAKKNDIAVEVLKGNAEDLLSLNIIDQIIKEPLGGAHHDPQFIYREVKEFILKQVKSLQEVASAELVEKRYQKIRALGEFEIKEEFETLLEPSEKTEP